MTTWRSCSSCKRPIQSGQTYWVCAVSTCNRPATNFVFCRPSCWDAHISVMNHRSAWCEERVAPAAAAPVTTGAPLVAAPTGPRTAPSPPEGTAQRRVVRPEAPPQEDDVLIVASRLKEYIDRKSGMNTSAEVLQALSDIVRRETDRAIERARDDGRRTVKGRDFY